MALGNFGRSRRREDKDDTAAPVLITSARKPYEEELADRKRRYFILMSIRIPALLLAMIAFMIWHNGWIALAIIAGSIPIPWIAVLGANDRPRRSKHEPKGYAAGSLVTTQVQRQLGPSGVVHSTERPPHRDPGGFSTTGVTAGTDTDHTDAATQREEEVPRRASPHPDDPRKER